MGSAAIQEQVFKKGSRTYFTSSLFFPPAVRADVAVLYGFVRVADDFVDAVPQDRAGFESFRAAYERARGGQPAGDPIIDPFVRLAQRKRFDPAWVDAFLDSMQADLTRTTYDSIDDTLTYIYGSAEVIGLFMARILDLPEKALPFARLMGRAMQYINFIRDLSEDRGLGRRYLPLAGTGMETLDADYARKNPDRMAAFIEHHLALYRSWQEEAEKGFAMIPRRFRIPIKTASDMYKWTARQIERRPFVVFDHKVKPPKSRIILKAVSNSVFSAPHAARA
jgi:15-cis-phytoene synthase